MENRRATLSWMDLVWLAFLGGLALLQPRVEIHKQFTLLAIGLFQIFEHWFIGRLGAARGRAYSVLIKIALASLLVHHTDGIRSSYYLIYFLPVVTAAMFYEGWATLLWTGLSSAAYCSFLIPALYEFELTADGATELAIRNLFFFLAAILVNRFVTDNRRQAQRYQMLAETLAETNRQLELAQAEARRSERLAALGQLSAGLAHELRNPLGVIKGSAEMLSKKLQTADAVSGELAGFISAEVNRLNTIVTRFLDFARPVKLDLRPGELPPVVEAALKAVRERWPDSKVEVERHYADALPLVPMDADLCDRVFTNLILNAYQAMPEGGKIKLTIAANNSADRPGVIVDIEDTGAGVPAELREQIFNPFFTTKNDGVGLGLSIVSKIVDEHGGWIRVVSEPGHGACFRVFLPVAENT
jgi:two-component system sensor histidine kinase HydH